MSQRKKNRGLAHVDLETYCSAHNLFYSTLSSELVTRESDRDLRRGHGIEGTAGPHKRSSGARRASRKGLWCKHDHFSQILGQREICTPITSERKNFTGTFNETVIAGCYLPNSWNCVRAHCGNRGFRAREIFSELSRFPVSGAKTLRLEACDRPAMQTVTVQ